MASVLSGLVSRMNLRYPTLFRILVVVILLAFFVPDMVPFVDEVGLTILTLLVSQWKNRRALPARQPREAAVRGTRSFPFARSQS